MIKTCDDCGRPKCTSDDVRRWQAWQRQPKTDATEPAWASAICWTIGPKCLVRPIDKPDLRDRMLAFAAELEKDTIESGGTGVGVHFAAELRRRVAGKETT